MWVCSMCDTSQTCTRSNVYCPRPNSSNTAAHITATPPEWDNSSQRPVGSINHVQLLPSVTSHSTVNHSLHFIDPGTGIHTQNVESYWNHVKGKFKCTKGIHEEMMSLYLDEFMWRERHGSTVSTAFTNLCRNICLRCPN